MRDGGAFIHNGIIDIPERPEDISDTRQFVNQIINHLPDRWERDVNWCTMVRKMIGPGSKVVALWPDGAHLILNESAGHWEEDKGVWYSNNSCNLPQVRGTAAIPFPRSTTSGGDTSRSSGPQHVNVTQRYRSTQEAENSNERWWPPLPLMFNDPMRWTQIGARAVRPATQEEMKAYQDFILDQQVDNSVEKKEAQRKLQTETTARRFSIDVKKLEEQGVIVADYTLPDDHIGKWLLTKGACPACDSTFDEPLDAFEHFRKCDKITKEINHARRGRRVRTLMAQASEENENA